MACYFRHGLKHPIKEKRRKIVVPRGFNAHTLGYKTFDELNFDTIHNQKLSFSVSRYAIGTKYELLSRFILGFNCSVVISPSTTKTFMVTGQLEDPPA
jgi:hypothetical protein